MTLPVPIDADDLEELQHPQTVLSRHYARSWFDRTGCHVLRAKLKRDLRGRFRRGVKMVTLTIDQTRYPDREAIYDKLRRECAVSRFLTRLGRELGFDFKGKWFRRTEFTKNGYVHFHLLLDTRQFIPHELLSRLWSYGHVWISPSRNKAVGYVCKYLAKPATSLPPYILARPSRTVRLVSSSRGFWPPKPPSACPRRKQSLFEWRRAREERAADKANPLTVHKPRRVADLIAESDQLRIREWDVACGCYRSRGVYRGLDPFTASLGIRLCCLTSDEGIRAWHRREPGESGREECKLVVEADYGDTMDMLLRVQDEVDSKRSDWLAEIGWKLIAEGEASAAAAEGGSGLHLIPHSHSVATHDPPTPGDHLIAASIGREWVRENYPDVLQNMDNWSLG